MIPRSGPGKIRAWRARSAPLGRGTGLRRSGSQPRSADGDRPALHVVTADWADVLTLRKTGRKDTIPKKVRDLVHGRDDHHCNRCGGYFPDGIHLHHRRIKGHGGDSRPHTDCACDLLSLCGLCHHAVHVTDRPAAEEEGFIVPRSTVLPGRITVLVRETGSGLTLWPTCDGQWTRVPPWERGDGGDVA